MKTVSGVIAISSGKKKGKRPIQKPKKEPLKKAPKRGKAPESEPSEYPQVTEEILKSDEALWKLYHEWVARINPNRTPEDMKMRFEYFKKTAATVYKHALEYNRTSGGLNCFADLTDEERRKRFCCGFSCPHGPLKSRLRSTQTQV